MGYEKDYDKWNNKKKDLNKRVLPDSFFFLDREIWWTSTGVNIGNEIDGKHDNFERPVLILKKFNENSFIGLPITSQKNKRDLKYTILYKGELNYILLNQIRSYSSNRLLRLIRRLGEVEFELIKEKSMNSFI